MLYPYGHIHICMNIYIYIHVYTYIYIHVRIANNIYIYTWFLNYGKLISLAAARSKDGVRVTFLGGFRRAVCSGWFVGGVAVASWLSGAELTGCFTGLALQETSMKLPAPPNYPLRDPNTI